MNPIQQKTQDLTASFKQSFPLHPRVKDLFNTNQVLKYLLQDIYQKNVKNVPFNQLQFDSSIIGQGVCSVVCVGLMPTVNQQGAIQLQRCACKRINLIVQNMSDENIVKTFEAILKEIILLQQISLKNHPNIIKLLGISLDVEFIIILEFCSEGNLRQAINAQKLDLVNKIDKMIQTAEALKVLHEMNIAHLDIKPENILLDQNGKTKLTDFGISKELNYRETIQTMGAIQNFGTLGFCAPEQYLDKQLVTRHTDIWSFGCLILFVMTGEQPYQSEVGNQNILMVIMQNFMAKKPPQVPQNLPQDIKQIIECCTQFDPKQRPDINNLLNMLQSALQSRGVTQNPPHQQIEALSKELKVAQEELTKSNLQRNQVMESYKLLQAQIQNLVSENQQLKNKQIQPSNNEQVQKIESLINENQNFKKYIDLSSQSIKQEKETFVAQINSLNIENQNLKKQIQKLEDELLAHKLSMTELQKQPLKLQEELKESVLANVQKVQEINTLKAKISQLEQEIKAQKPNSNVSQSQSCGKTQDQDLHSKVRELEEEITKQRKNFLETYEQLNSKEARINQLSTQNENLKTKLQNLAEKNEIKSDETNQFQGQNKKLQQENEQLKQNLAKVNQKLQESQQQIQILNQRPPQERIIVKRAENGKIYCGRSLGVSCECCDGQCGPNSGCNCVSCMEMDIKSRNLQKGQLINSQGHVSTLYANGEYSCGKAEILSLGLMGIIQKCTPNQSCTPCKRLSILARTRYSSLL